MHNAATSTPTIAITKGTSAMHRAHAQHRASRKQNPTANAKFNFIFPSSRCHLGATALALMLILTLALQLQLQRPNQQQ